MADPLEQSDSVPVETGSLAEFRARWKALEAKTGESDAQTTNPVSQQEANDRSWIAKRIIGIFTGVVAGVLAILTFGGIRTGEWAAADSQAVDLIRSAVLPVVTLVLGYYFGRSGKG